MRILLILILIMSLLSCNSDDSEKNISNKNNQDSLNLAIANSKFPLITYTRVLIKDKDHREQIMHEYRDTDSNSIKNKIFCTLNRKERRFMKVGDTILVPDSIIKDVRCYSIFPNYYSGAKDLPKLIMVSNKYQSYACYEYGNLIRFVAVNTGKERTPTYPGRYALVWKQLERKSSLDSTWVMPFTFNFHKYAGNAFHQFTMPGYAASHSCIRQFRDDAKWLYHWGEGSSKHLKGTPVIILDVYDYANKKYGPWKYFKSNKDFFVDLPKDPMQVEEALIPITQIPATSRGILPNKHKYVYAEDTLRARGHIREVVKLTPSINFNKLRREKAEKKKKLEEQKKIMTNP